MDKEFQECAEAIEANLAKDKKVIDELQETVPKNVILMQILIEKQRKHIEKQEKCIEVSKHALKFQEAMRDRILELEAELEAEIQRQTKDIIQTNTELQKTISGFSQELVRREKARLEKKD